MIPPMLRLNGRLAWPLALTLTACAQGNAGTDGGVRSDARRDGGRDAGVRDSGIRDSGPRDGGRDAGRMDSGPPMDSGPRDSGPRDSGRDTGPPGCRPAVGSLVIVEVMISSRSGAGDRGEWFEAVNTGSCSIDLAGVVIASGASTGGELTHTISGGSVAPSQRYVFALSSAIADNHALPHDYAYGSGAASDVIFNNTADWLELREAGVAVDRVVWPTGGFTHGRARQFPGTPSATGNDIWSNWCDATMVYSTTGGTFYGTPRMANGTCP
jgi:hypothetical protein